MGLHPQRPAAARADDDTAELVGASVRCRLGATEVAGFGLDHALPERVRPRGHMAPLDQLPSWRLDGAMPRAWRELAWQPHPPDRGDRVLSQQTRPKARGLGDVARERIGDGTIPPTLARH